MFVIFHEKVYVGLFLGINAFTWGFKHYKLVYSTLSVVHVKFVISIDIFALTWLNSSGLVNKFFEFSLGINECDRQSCVH